MNWNVIIRPSAEADAREAMLWYESQRPGLGEELLQEIRRAIHLLEERPDSRPLYYRGFRRMMIRRFPYKIFYSIEANRVIVFRILHGRRHHPPQLNG
jgi:plasmid stabilization system protein ParE